ncbi:MAG: Bug family tripartite tricarboxylate transporter substrate binding protein [Acetobacteraceae bacterium]
MHTTPSRITRRTAIAGLGAALSLPAIHRAGAQGTWPSKPVRLIMPYAPGGAGDTLARPWADALTQSFGSPFVVENRGGASGTIGAEAAARSTPDGTTFLITPNSALNVVPQLRKVGYDARKDLMPVGRVGNVVGGFGILRSLPIGSMAELVAYAKKHPGRIAFGSAGLGTSTQLRLETLKLRAGIDILHVPYRGSGDAMVDLLSGQVHMMNEIVIFPHVKAGKLALLAINNDTRHWDFPEVPTMTEAGFPDADVPIWFSVWAPAGTSKEIIAILSERIGALSKTPETKQRLREISFVPVVQTPEEVLAFFERDWQANADVIREARITLS